MSCGTQDATREVWRGGVRVSRGPVSGTPSAILLIADRGVPAVIATTVDGDRLAHVDRHH